MRKALLSIFLVSLILLSSIYLLPMGSSSRERVAFLVKSSLYPEIKCKLSELFEDAHSYDFVVKEIQGQSPSQIRAWLKMEYENYGLVGAVLVGNIPLARYHNPLFNEMVEFPYYYMNLNGDWADENGDGIIDDIPQNYAPQIWVGIVRSTDMDGNNATQINNYIQKVLNYLGGKISVEPRSVAFVDDDFLFMVDKLRASLYYPYVGFDIVDKNTTSEAFLKFLMKDYPYGFIVAHSNGGEYFIKQSGYWEYVKPQEIRAKGLFYTDESCYAGNFEKGAIANYLIMGKGSQGLGVLTFTGRGRVSSMDAYYFALGEGKSFGESLVYYIQNLTKNPANFNEHIAMLTYIGFPFLKPWRPGGYKEMAPFSIEGNEELVAYAKKYGWPGKGTEKDPIQITGIMIFTGYWRDGIALSNISLYVKIHHCYILVRNGNGISVAYSQHVEIDNNTLYYAGIFVADSSNIFISHNEIKWGFTYVGYSIDLLNVSNAEILGNRISIGWGIGVSGKFSYVQEGQNWTMVPHYVENVRFESNVLINTVDGVYLNGVKNSKVLRNVVDFWDTGLRLRYSCNNSIEKNNFTMHFITKNHLYGIMLYVFLYHSCNNRIYLNNFFYSGDIPQYVDFHKFFRVMYDSFSTPEEKMINYWNNSKYGNYYEWWANKNDTNDKNHDGIVDYAWIIDENNTDYRPLKHPFRWWLTERKLHETSYLLELAVLIIAIIGILVAVYMLRRKKANF